MRWLVAVGLIAYGTVAHADTKFVVYGPGGRPCSEWTLDRAENNAGTVVKEAWLTGYISGTNSLWPKDTQKGTSSADVLAGTNLTTVEHRIDHYCLDHPRAPIVDAVDSVVGAMLEAGSRARFNALIEKATRSP